MPAAKDKGVPPVTRRFIRIEGQLATLIEEHAINEVPLGDLQQKLVEAMPDQQKAVSTPVLPTGCRFYASDERYETYIIEQPPRKRVMLTGGSERLKGFYDTGFFAKERREAYAMPYVIFAVSARPGAKSVSTGQVRVAFSKEPLRSAKDRLLEPALPNIYRNGMFCTATMEAGVGANTCEAVEDLIANFWGSRFTYESDATFPGTGKVPRARVGAPHLLGADHGKDFEEWIEFTKTHGDMAGLDIPWRPLNTTVTDFLKRRGLKNE